MQRNSSDKPDLVRWEEQSDTKGEDPSTSTGSAAEGTPEAKDGFPYMGPPPFDSGKGKK